MDFLSYIISKLYLKLDTYMPHFSLPGPLIFHQKKGRLISSTDNLKPRDSDLNGLEVGYQHFSICAAKVSTWMNFFSLPDYPI